MFLVTVNNTYTNQSQTRDQIVKALQDSGKVTFRKSRRDDSFEFVVVDGHTVARAFNTKENQISYLVRVGIL